MMFNFTENQKSKTVIMIRVWKKNVALFWKIFTFTIQCVIFGFFFMKLKDNKKYCLTYGRRMFKSVKNIGI